MVGLPPAEEKGPAVRCAMDKVLVVDYGAQYAQLIARRVRECHVYSEIVPHSLSPQEIAALRPAGVILSGGPKSVHQPGAPSCDPDLFGLGIPNVHLRKGDMYGALPSRLKGRVDVITAHVPYVPLDELEDLPTEVKGYEPIYTLTDHSDDGLGLMRAAVDGAKEFLKPGGWLLLEMSDDVVGRARRMCRRAGFEDKGMVSDDDDLSVVVEARA